MLVYRQCNIVRWETTDLRSIIMQQLQFSNVYDQTQLLLINLF